jgi:hypothetical protein
MNLKRNYKNHRYTFSYSFLHFRLQYLHNGLKGMVWMGALYFMYNLPAKILGQ